MLPGARSIVVRDQIIPYILKGDKGRYIGDSGAVIRLVFQLDSKYVSAYFLSKKYKPEIHEEGYESHKISFTPKDVHQVIEYYFDTGNIDENLVLEDWKFSV